MKPFLSSPPPSAPAPAPASLFFFILSATCVHWARESEGLVGVMHAILTSNLIVVGSLCFAQPEITGPASCEKSRRQEGIATSLGAWSNCASSSFLQQLIVPPHPWSERTQGLACPCPQYTKKREKIILIKKPVLFVSLVVGGAGLLGRPSLKWPCHMLGLVCWTNCSSSLLINQPSEKRKKDTHYWHDSVPSGFATAFAFSALKMRQEWFLFFSVFNRSCDGASTVTVAAKQTQWCHKRRERNVHQLVIPRYRTFFQELFDFSPDSVWISADTIYTKPDKTNMLETNHHKSYTKTSNVFAITQHTQIQTLFK